MMWRGTPSDVPLHRGSVGAMQIAGCNRMPESFRPYFYRGTGEDTLGIDPEAARNREKAARKREKARLKREAEMAKRRADAAVRREVEKRRREAARAEDFVRREAARQQREAEREAEDAGWLAPVIPLFPETQPDPEPPKPKARKRPVFTGPPRPAAGWKPLTGGDIDDLFQELEDDD